MSEQSGGGESRETRAAQDLVEDAWQVNLKGMFDKFEHQFHVQANQTTLQLGQLSNVALQALQNAVETSNMVAKQAVAHRDIAIRGEWDLTQQAAIDAIAAAVVDRLTKNTGAGANTGA